MSRPRKTPTAPPREAKNYRHSSADLAARPEIGAQAHFKKTKAPATYRFDSSLAPELCWDDRNPAREEAEHQLAVISEQLSVARAEFAKLREQVKDPVDKKRFADSQITAHLSEVQSSTAKLKAMSRPFLNWTGKAERLSFDVPTLPLFVHERLSTKAILETLKGHTRDKQESFLDSLFASPERSLHDQILRAYEHRDAWVNRLILGDSMVAMNSLLRFESLGGQVQTIYMDPPYGVKFGSNFQPFIRKRDVSHNDDADMTREPEMVQAYRDTWELGLHSYLTYLRDRLFLARDLLTPSGSIFVQISDENLHHVREVMDEVFGAENFCARINVIKTAGQTDDLLPSLSDSLLWFSRDKTRVRYRNLFASKGVGFNEVGQYYHCHLPTGEKRRMSQLEIENPDSLPVGTRFFRVSDISSNKYYSLGRVPFEFEGKTFLPPEGRYWTHSPEGREALKKAGRLVAIGNSVRFIGYLDDFPFSDLNNQWIDTGVSGFATEKLYVVQTNPKIIERCLLMTTDPGDLVLDPTCGSGTTAYVAEQWGRRWITCDTSRVPLALARQRLLTATFDYYELKDEARGPSGGFVYKRKQNQKGEEVGGIVPHVTLKSIANNEPPAEEVLVDRPEVVKNLVRVTGPFSFEATIPTASQPQEFQVSSCEFQDGTRNSSQESARNLQLETGNSSLRMLEVLRRSPVLRLPGNQTVTLKNIRPPAKTLTLSAEALVEVSSFEFQVSSGEKDERQISGSGRVAKGNGSGAGNLSTDAGLSSGRAIRPDEPVAPGVGVGAQQHCGGAGAIDPGGVSAISRSGTRLVAGGADAGGTGGAVALSARTGSQPVAGASAGSSAVAERSDLETRNVKLETLPVAILFGPENGPISERFVREAWDEAGLKHYTRLYVIGFAIDPKARQFIEDAGEIGLPCTYLQATMDLQMGDLLKNMRSSQIFSVCGLPDVKVSSFEFPVSSGKKTRNPNPETRNLKLETLSYQVELQGLDTFDPTTMEADHLKGADVPAWFLDTDYNGMVFRVRQAFFPRTGAWENLKKSLKVEFEDAVWDHLAGTTSAPFPAGEHGQIAVKVIDPRGNELLVVKKLEETK